MADWKSKAKDLYAEKENKKKYGEGYSAESIKKQAETIKQWDTDADVSTFLNGAVKDGVITSNDANNIYKEVTGNKNALYSKENVDYVNNAYKVAYNIPIKKEETKEVSPYADKYKELDHDGVVRAYNDLYAEYAETGDGRLLDELGYLKTKSEETAGREVLSWKSGQAAKRAEEKRNKLKTDAEVMQYVNVYPEAFKVTKEDRVDIYTVDREKLKEYNIPDAQIEKIEKEIRKRNSGVLGMNLHVQDAEKYASMARNSNFIELEHMSSVSSPDSDKYDENYESYVEKGKTLAVTEFGKEWTYTTSSRGNYLKGQKIDAYKAVALVMAERDGYKIPEEILKEGSNKDLIEKYRNTTNDELNAVAYYIAKDKETGGKQAYRYVDLLEDAVMTRHGTKRADETTGFLGNFALTADAGLEQFEQGIERNFDDKYYYPVTSAQVAVAKTTEDLRKEGRNFAAGAMDFGVAAFNMAPSILVSTALSLALSPAVGALSAAGTTGSMAAVGAKVLGYIPKIAGATTMGLSARGNAYAQMVNQGYSKEQADAYGNMVMVSEVALESVLGGISKFGGISPKVAKAISKVDNVLARLAIQYPVAFVGEGAEEGLQAILEPIFKEIALGYDTGEEIDWEQVAYEALLGGIMGGFFESPEIISSNSKMYFNDKATGKKVNLLHNTEALIERAKNDTSNKSNLKKATKIENSNKNTDTKVGALFRHMVEDGQITQAEAQRLVSEGLDGAPLSEGEQAFYYAGASGLSVTEAAELNSYLDVDPERAISAWQKGAEIKDGKPKIKVDRSAIEDAVIKNEVKRQADSVPGAKAGIKTGAKTVSYTPENKKGPEAISGAKELKDENYRVVAEKYRTEENGKEFDLAYSLGLTGEEITGLELTNISDDARIAAYFAGRHDASSLAEKRRAFEGRRPGVSQDGVTAAILSRYSKRTREVIDAIGKKLGVEIRLVTRSSDRENPDDSIYNYSKGVVEININEKHENLKGDKLIRFILTHEAVHRIMETSPKAYREMEKIALSKSETTIEEKMAEYECSREDAIEEIVADYFGDLLSSKAEIRALMNEHRNVFDVIYEAIEWLCNKLRGTGVTFTELAEARKLFKEALSEADSNVWGKEVRSEGDTVRSENVKWSKSEVKIELNDIEKLRSIVQAHNGERVSVNDFTGRDIKEAENFAKKYFEELGVKSPFFRAWFGDWREGERNSTNIVLKPAEIRGEYINKDTNWNLIVSRQVHKETSHHGSKKAESAKKYLPYIKEITENAILLDSFVSDDENSLSAMYHKLYAYSEAFGYPALLKLTVEELVDEKTGDSIMRDYILHNIEEESLSKRNRLSTPNHDEGNSSVINISDLYALVKQFDKSFKPKPSSLVVNEEDGTPMVVYHGTDSKFTAFDISKGRANMDIQGAFFSPWELDAKGYGENVGQYFLNIKKPASGEVAFTALNRFKGQNNAGVKAREYLIKQGYDGVNFYGEEYVAFYPTQIKSATDNIGTFNGEDADIKRSKSDKGKDKGLTNDKKTDYNVNGEQFRVMWTLEEGILDRSEVARVYEAMGEVKRGTEFPETPAGEYILDLYDKIAIVGGSYNYPEVARVITFDIEDSYLRAIAMEEVIQYGMETTESDIWLPIIEAMYGQGNVAIRDYRDSKAFSREIGRRNGITGQRNSRGAGSGGDVKRSKSTTEDTDVKYFPPGEKPRRAIDVPSEIDGEKVRRFVRTAAEAPAVSDEIAEDVVSAVENGHFFYEQSSNATLIAAAETLIEDGRAERIWSAVTEGKKVATDLDIAVGEALLRKASNEGDSRTAMKLISEIAIEGTRAGKVVQAMKLLKRMTPEGQVYYLEKSVEKINEARGKKKGEEFNEALRAENRERATEKALEKAEANEKAQKKKVADLEEAIREATEELTLESEISEASESLKNLREELSDAKRQTKNKDANSKKLSEQIEEVKRQIAEAEKTLKEATEKRNALYEERKKAGAENSAIKKNIKATEKATEKLLGRIEILESEISEAKDRYEKAKSFADELSAERKKLKGERDSLKKKIASAEKASERDVKKIADLESEIRELSEKYAEAKRVADGLAENRRELTEERNRLKEKLERTERKTEREAEKIKKLRENIAALLNDLYEADRELAKAKKETDIARQIKDKAAKMARAAQSKAGKVELPESIKKAILESKTEEELQENVDFATDYIAANMTATWGEKVKAWRYTMMLGNIRTQGRNFIGNAIMLLPTMTKNVIATPLEFITVSGYNKFLESKGEKMLKEGYTQEEVNQYIEDNRAYRTKTITFLKKKSEEIRDFADKSWEENSKLAMQGAKYDDVKDGINEKRRIFKSDVFESYRKATSWAMEKGDEIFLKINYKQAITSFMLSNKLTPDTITEAQKLRAEQYAIKEAREATFRDKSKIAEALNRVKGVNWATELFLGGLIPFTTTPINVTKRAFEYSPLGIIKVASDIANFKGGKVEINEVVNSLAKLLTGSALTYLGFALAAKGLLRAVGDDDEEEYDYLIGEQDYALKIGDYRYTIEWASPSAIPLLLGGAIWQSFFGEKGGMKEAYFIDENGELQLNMSYMKAGNVINSMINLFSPIFDATYLSGLSDALEAGGSFSSNPGEAVTAFFLESILNYGGQFVPTWLGQLARTIDSSERRNNDYDRTNPLPYQVQKGIAKIKNKIPFLNQTSTPYVNAWGEEEIKQGAIDYILSGVENFISPGYIEKVSDDELTSELWRLENTEAAKDKKIFPEAVPYSFTEDEKKYTFNPEQHNEYQKVTGKTARELISGFVDSDVYGDLSDEERAEAVNILWKYANAEGVKAVYPDYTSKDSNVVKLNFAKDNVGVQPVDYALWKIAVEKADYFGEDDRKGYGNGSINQDEADQALGIFADMTDSDIKEVALAYLWQMQTDGVSKNNPYGYALRGTPWYRANGKDYNNKLWMKPKE